MKTSTSGRVRAIGTVVLIFSAAFLSGCAGLVSGNPTPPSTVIISNLQSGAITTSSSQVVWTTNVAADSSVDYGTTSAYGNITQVNSAMVTSHQVTLTALAAGTTYYYQVNSTDSKGNHGHGGNSFKTAGYKVSGTINPTPAGNGATVALSGAGTASTTADNSGNYTFAGLPNGFLARQPKRDSEWNRRHRGRFYRDCRSDCADDHHATGESDGDRGTNGELLGSCSRDRAAKLPVAEEWREYRGCNVQQLHDTCYDNSG